MIGVNEEYEQAQLLIDRLWEQRSVLMKQGEQEWQNHWHPIWLERYGKAKGKQKDNTPKATDFPSGELAAMMKPFQAKWTPLVDAICKQRQAAMDKLVELAPHMDYLPSKDCYVLVKTSSSNSYNSQGFGAVSYARAELGPYEAKFKALGFDPMVRVAKQGTYRLHQSAGGWSMSYADFDLWVNCTPAEGDAAMKLVTMADAIKYCNQTSTNIHVLIGV